MLKCARYGRFDLVETIIAEYKDLCNYKSQTLVIQRARGYIEREQKLYRRL